MSILYKNIPVYYSSIEYAKKAGELEQWRESYRINLDLRRYLENNASNYYNTYRLHELIDNLDEKYGVERCMYLIARTIQYRCSYDGRFYKSVFDRAAAFSYPDAHTEAVQEAEKIVHGDIADKSKAYISDVHSCILNDIFRELMKLEQKQSHNQSKSSEQLGGMSFG